MNKTLIKNVALNIREHLIRGIVEKARNLEIVVEHPEEIAYLWFVRLIAMRFLEVNQYINYTMEEMLSNKLAFIKGCTDLSHSMPAVFEIIHEDTYTLLPDTLFGERSLVADLIYSIDESYWKMELYGEKWPCKLKVKNEEKRQEEQEENEMEAYGVEIIGWFYQYFFSVKKDEIFSELKRKKLTKNHVSTATQIFTPKWIVQYMVENTLGKLWMEYNPKKELLSKWKYWIGDEDEPALEKDRRGRFRNKNLNPEEIKVLDPAMGSGNILSYAFDVLYDIYLAHGYSVEKIPLLILEKNLYGLDIDDRVSRLAIFTILMKARSKDRQILSRRPRLNLISIEESKEILNHWMDSFSPMNEANLKDLLYDQDLQYLIHVFQNAKEYGALLYIKNINFDELEKRVEDLRRTYHNDLSESEHLETLFRNIQFLIKQGRILNDQYDVVIANPPYSGLRRFNKVFKVFADENYKDYRYDLFSMFIIRNLDFTKDQGFTSFMTPNVWQFISSYEKLRNYIINNHQLLSLIQLEEDGFKEASVAISTFVIRKSSPMGKSIFIKGNYENQQQYKEDNDTNNLHQDKKFYVDQRIFNRITGSKIAFWIGENTIKTFENGQLLGDICKPRQGMATSDNQRFLRYWYEESFEDIGFSNKRNDLRGYKWVPYNKGGGYRKWYGNNLYVIHWEKDGYEVKEYAQNLYGNYTRTIKNEDFYFKEGITYAFIGKDLSPRYSPEGFIFDVAGSMIFVEKNKLFYILGLLASKLSKYYMDFMNPSINKQVGDIKSIPFIEPTDSSWIEKINHLVKENIRIAKRDWDSFELSWDFKRHPLLAREYSVATVEEAYDRWATFAEDQFNLLKKNEETLNSLFIRIYKINQELTPEVEDKDITIRKADKEREIKSFISYAVGCMFGRYSLDLDGLIYAGGTFDQKFKFYKNQWYIKVGEDWKKSTIPIVENNCIPIVENGQVEGDIFGRFIGFLEKVFGPDTLEVNLNYIAKVLGNKKGQSAKIFIKRYFYNDFFAHHSQMYKKRPIYLLTSQENGYKFLIYKHRLCESNVDKKKE